jgi:hypothetical protein
MVYGPLFKKVYNLDHLWYSKFMDAYPVTTSHAAYAPKINLYFHVICVSLDHKL